MRFPVGDGFENIVTNLPEEEFGAEEIKAIYGMRWGIETSFRKLKLNIGAVELHSKRAPLVMQEVLARMVPYDFCAAVAAYVSRLPGSPVSAAVAHRSGNPLAAAQDPTSSRNALKPPYGPARAPNALRWHRRTNPEPGARI